MVFTLKNRHEPFTDEILRRCKRTCAPTSRQSWSSSTDERDHVHLLNHYPPKAALSRLVGSLNGVSARRLRQELPGHIRKYLWREHFWSPSYFAARYGGASLTVINEYIKNQKHPS